MPADKTGAHATISAEEGRYTISADGRVVGYASFADRGDQRVFDHTEIHPEFGGRGLATPLVEEALNGARDTGKRIDPVCSMIGTVLNKHPEFDEITAQVNDDVLRWARTASNG
ncbi:GNAT family N-acetyltransferase [Mycobacterium sp. THU-M104]|uniref:GNAT family N-acetyltransferase n=1 Tax=Mycobacterium sp. THU-M104 TaxID=3410515 RepID=UPI003B9C2B00